MPYIYPASASKIRSSLVKEHLQMQKGNVSYVFYPSQSILNMNDLEVVIEGEMVEMVGSKIVSRNNRKFILSFIYEGGKLMLSNLIESQ